MPRGDRTGPMGSGPMTGRGAGYCAGAGMPGFMNLVTRGGCWGSGGGRGWRHWFHATGLLGWTRAGTDLPAWGRPAYPYAPPAMPEMAGKADVVALKTYAAQMEQALNALRQRIQKLEGPPKTE